MARPEEKARSMLNKWVAMREEGNAPVRNRRRRPFIAAECDDVKDAQHWRRQIIREMTESIAKIQNPALAENEIRELNDTINHKIREKWHWNKRIRELGGPDFNAIERKRRIEEGDTQQGGYRYFGAAKNLPGVKELLEKQKEKLQKKSRGERVNPNPDYFGWRDEEDGVLLEVEEAANSRLYKKSRQEGRVDLDPMSLGVGYFDGLPTDEEVSQALLEEKKKALLAKYSL